MQMNGVTATQVRGFADQRLRKKAAPLDPSNRRISVIVQYLVKPGTEDTSAAGVSEVASTTKTADTKTLAEVPDTKPTAPPH
jgi:chemotaxis protein MotB